MNLLVIFVFILVQSCTGDDGPCLDDYQTEDGHCLPYATEYYGRCVEDGQCEWLGENSACLYKACMCKEGYRWYRGECKKFVGLGEDCADNLDCFDGYNPLSLSCKENKCTCSDGYYQRYDTDCRKIAKSAGEPCALDLDCQFKNGVCVVGKCAVGGKSLPLVEEFFEEVDYSISIDAAASACKIETDCQGANCEYFKGDCVCKRGYFLDVAGSSCIAEIGINVGCRSDSDCPLKPGKCAPDGACYCRDYYFTQNDNRKCVKTMSQTNWNCVSQEWCYALGPFSYCSSENSCKCSKVATLDQDQSICNRTTLDPNICSLNIQCQGNMPNSLCIDEACQCKSNYRLENDKCVPNIGYPCNAEESPCTIKNAQCWDNLCQCFTNYISSDNTTCHQIVNNLGEDCEIDVQCSAKFDNTLCKDRVCSCQSNYLQNKNSCIEKKEYMSYCTNLQECTLSLGDSFVCRNSKCQCPTGSTYRGSYCASRGTTLATSTILAMSLIGLLKSVL